MKRNLKIQQAVLFIAILLGLLFIHNSLFARDKAAQIDQLMQFYHDDEQFHGSVLVAERGKIIFKKGYGYANLEWNIQNQPNTKHRIGSITKQFTSMLIMQLAEEKKLKLNDNISRYLPDYRKDTGERVTIHHLLNHSSGIPSYTEIPNFHNDISRDPYSVDEFIKQFCSGDLEFQPGSQYSYNNSGYFLLGAIIEKITGKSFEQVLQERITKPLNMKNTGYDHHEIVIPMRAIGYDNTLQGLKNASYLDMSTPYAAGAMYSTVEDLYLWDQALYKTLLLSKKSKIIMFEPYLDNYAYGWFVKKIKLEKTKKHLTLVSHSGGINGFNTLIWRLVDDRHLVVILSNLDRAPLNDMFMAITHILYDVAYDQPKKTLSRSLYQRYLEGGLIAVMNQYHDLKKNNVNDFNWDAYELDRLAGHLIEMKKIDDAIKIFQLNIKAHPDKYFTYFRLGEVYLKKGDKILAIKNLAKSLEINPKFTYALEILKTIH